MSFLLSGRDGTVRADGPVRQFGARGPAVDAARAGSAMVGAFSFEPEGPAALSIPERLVRDSRPLTGQAPLRHSVALRGTRPDANTHRDRVAAVRDSIAAGAAGKVVLARAIELATESAVDEFALTEALAGGNAEHNAFCVDLSAAGPDYRDRLLIGASPELLVSKRGAQVYAHPYAGSAPRSTDPAADQAAAQSLSESAKDHAEHRFVVDYLREALGPFCVDVQAPDTPVLLATGEVWHLATPIVGTLADPSITSLELALALHPTPAVCGTPTASAAAIIAEVEGPRGFYSGAIGYNTEAGDGDWMVAIRCAELSADRRSLIAHAGGGIVAQSDPEAELAETTTKFATILRALTGSAVIPARADSSP
ncbi:isochorismate synthase [Jongsikchunia kroppenstedtii]|uniref:isochorismate synthase n=1 Tax=Jongsikchunia kroppenstedtii TaxID=1121721 RepID=UPI00036D1ED8|nr:isochorismate synthase [Jongsikchunia kroppenstedtii]